MAGKTICEAKVLVYLHKANKLNTGHQRTHVLAHMSNRMLYIKSILNHICCMDTHASTHTHILLAIHAPADTCIHACVEYDVRKHACSHSHHVMHARHATHAGHARTPRHAGHAQRRRTPRRDARTHAYALGLIQRVGTMRIDGSMTKR